MLRILETTEVPTRTGGLRTERVGANGKLVQVVGITIFLGGAFHTTMEVQLGLFDRAPRRTQETRPREEFVDGIPTTECVGDAAGFLTSTTMKVRTSELRLVFTSIALDAAVLNEEDVTEPPLVETRLTAILTMATRWTSIPTTSGIAGEERTVPELLSPHAALVNN